MRVVVLGVDAILGLGVAARLISMGHDVIGVGHIRPESLSGAVEFVLADAGGAVAEGADGVVCCGPPVGLDAAVAAGARVVVTAPVGVAGVPLAGAITVRSALMLGRDADDALVRLFTKPLIAATAATIDRPLQVVHPHDVQRVIVRAVLDAGARAGTVDVAAKGRTTIRAIAAALGRPITRVPARLALPAAARLVQSLPVLEGAGPPPEWDAAPSWSAAECVEDFALVCRARISLGTRVIAVPWRLPRVREIPAVDSPSADGVAPVPAGGPGANGEFDTPIDPRFPAFVATNLSEALPGPFTPSSASVTVLGTRASGRVISERLRPGGAVQREMSRRTTGVFGHRLYAGITSGYFMAQTVPLVKPDMILKGFFGRTLEGLPLLGQEHPPIEHRGPARQLRGVATFANNLIGLSLGADQDTRDYIADVARLEVLAADPAAMDDRRLRALIVLARDHVVHGWVLSSASILVCTAYGVILRILCGRDVMPAPGADVASARSLAAIQRLAAAAERDPVTAQLLTEPGLDADALADRSPAFAAALARELALIGHRGPGEVEMRCATYSDDPKLLIRTVAKAMSAAPLAASARPALPVWARPVSAAEAGQLRQREVRRDRMVRAIWVLRGLLREYGRRLADTGALGTPDDVFYLTVDELDAPPPDVAGVVARRRAEQRSLAELAPPEAFSGRWLPTTATAVALTSGESIQGLGVCAGRVRGRVRVVRPDTIDELQPGEIMVAKVTDVGYTPAFAYVAAVVTELGGPISHAAIVAREYGVPCVVNVRGAADRLPTGALIEVDGATGHVTLLSM
jgi:phosphohistidine swiveling domain-containing protein